MPLRKCCLLDLNSTRNKYTDYKMLLAQLKKSIIIDSCVSSLVFFFPNIELIYNFQ